VAFHISDVISLTAMVSSPKIVRQVLAKLDLCFLGQCPHRTSCVINTSI
jgi:hypothetical protein